MKSSLLGGLALSVCVGVAGCGRGALSERYVEATTGYSRSYGAPKAQAFYVEAEAANSRLSLTVLEQSQCDVMRVRGVQRSRETLEGDRVIGRVDLGPSQVVEGVLGAVPCEARAARDVEVSLRAGTAAYALGVTDERGKLSTDLADVFRGSPLGTLAPVPGTATVIVAGRDVTALSLTEYRRYSEHLGTLLQEFRTIVDQENEKAVTMDIVRAYELYLTLRQLDRGDPRFAALEARFLEHQFQRGLSEAQKVTKKHAQILAEAKKLLGAEALRTSVPAHVIVAVEKGALSSLELQWALGQIVQASRTHAELCGAANELFGWHRAAASAPAVRLAFELARYGYGDAFQTEVRRVCDRVPGL